MESLKNLLIEEHNLLIQQLETKYLNYLNDLLKQKAFIHQKIQTSFYQKLFEINNIIQVESQSNYPATIHINASTQNITDSEWTLSLPSLVKDTEFNTENTNIHYDDYRLNITNCPKCNEEIEILTNMCHHIQSQHPDLEKQLIEHKILKLCSQCYQCYHCTQKHLCHQKRLIPASNATVNNKTHSITDLQDIALHSKNNTNINNVNIDHLLPATMPVLSDKINKISVSKWNNTNNNNNNNNNIETSQRMELMDTNNTMITEDDKKKAELLKTEGNELLSQKKYQEAIDKYTKAIDLNPMNAIYFSNRAAAQTKLKNYVQVAIDSRKASDIDPNYVKAYIREGLAEFQMKHYQKAYSAYSKALTKTIPIDDNQKRIFQQIQDKMKLCETKINEPNNGDKWLCDYCHQIFTNNNSLQRHISTHNEYISSQIELNNNTRNKTIFKCKYCPYKTKWRNTLKQHEGVHNRNKQHQYKCQQCTYSATSYWLIQRHQLLHSNNKGSIKYKNELLFKCPKCRNTFFKNCELKQHLKLHEGEKQFLCNKCNKQFEEIKYLQRHINNIHSNHT